jgi:LPXTG-site transpeptidase (sortase) family protein
MKLFKPFNSLLSVKTYLIAAFLLLGGLSGSAYYGFKLAHSQTVPSPTNNAVLTPHSTIAAHSVSQPTRLVIPKIGVNAPSTSLQLKADGTLETPNSATEVGWYRNSPTPGEIGPSVIVGHVDYVNFGAAVFWRLHELQPGDTFEVQRVDGSEMKFKVNAVKQFSQNDFPTTEVYGDINYAGIRLITCGGTFNSQTHHYSDNTVVFGSLVN